MPKGSRSRMKLRAKHDKVASTALLDELSHELGKKRRLRARFGTMVYSNSQSMSKILANTFSKSANRIPDTITARRCKSTKRDNYEVEDFIVVDVGTEAADKPAEEPVEESVEEPIEEPIGWKESRDMEGNTNRKKTPWIGNLDSNYDPGVLDDSSQALSTASLAESTQSRTLGIKLRQTSPDSDSPLTENPRGNLSSSKPCVNAVPRYRGLKLEDMFLSHVQLLVRSREPSEPYRVCPVSELMWRSSQDFFRWYTAESETISQTAVLLFRMVEICRQDETSLVFPGPLPFQQLKRTFWDIFWATSFFPESFRPGWFHIYVSVHCESTGVTVWLPSRMSTLGHTDMEELSVVADIRAVRGFAASSVLAAPPCPITASMRRTSNIYSLLNPL